MQEFSSISVSSYDAASLADRLTQQSVDGWEVVAIVPAGTNIVAYLARHTDSALVIPESADEETPAETADNGDADVASAAEDFSFTLASTSTPEAAAAETALADDEAAAEPVEPAGWASEPVPAEPEPTPEPEPSPQPEPDETPPSSDAVSSHEPQHVQHAQHAEAETASAEPAAEAQQQQAAAGAAPAGWYADPAGRFELRYWDGTQWTEHVSRAGQQYTDPPVA